MFAKAILALLLASGPADATDPDEGKYYKYGQLGVKKSELVGSKIELTFQPVSEQFFWCPGIKVQETKKAVVVTFLRCETKTTCPVDVAAKIGKKLVRTITIDTRGKDTYVKNGPKQYKRIYSIKEQTTKSKNRKTVKKAAEVTRAKEVQKASHIRFIGPDKDGWINNVLIEPRTSSSK